MNDNYALIEKLYSNDDISLLLDKGKHKMETDSKVGNRVSKETKIRKDVFFSQTESKEVDDKFFYKIQEIVKEKFKLTLKYRETYKLGYYYGDEKGFYIPHTDTQGDMQHRKISMVICLSKIDDYEGGIFKFINLKKDFKFDIGDTIIFDSNILHGVEPVTFGKRQVLISFMWDEEGEQIRQKNNPTINNSRYLPNNNIFHNVNYNQNIDVKEPKLPSIFVSIASFLDKDIIETIKSCLNKAKYPNNITIGICLQYDFKDNFLSDYENNPNIKFKNIHYSKAQGPTYARYLITQLIEDEDFFLQIDAHTRFYDNWDELAIKCYKECNDGRAIITNFPISFVSMNKADTYPLNKTSKQWEELSYNKIWQGFGMKSVKVFNPVKPERTYVISAALVFGPTKFLKEVPYDPLILYGYHKLEQVFYSARLYTSGWNLYCPTKHILSTYYGSKDKYDSLGNVIKCPLNGTIANQSWYRALYHYGLKTIEDIRVDFRKDIEKYGFGFERSIEDYFKCSNIIGPIEKLKLGLTYKQGKWIGSNKYNFYDFIEIGTSDFDTEISKEDCKKGISIEPIKQYINNLPNKENCIKLNMAISDNNGKSTIYYINEDNISKYNLGYRARGMNSINCYHPTLKRIFESKKLDIEKIYSSYEVETKTLMNVIKSNKVDGFYFLKIDTEGHDYYILKKFIEDIKENSYLPFKIQFESNILTKKEHTLEIINLLKNFGYDLISSSIDTIMVLNLKKIKKKNIFTGPILNYYIPTYNKYLEVNKFKTLDEAKDICIKYKCSGITYQNNMFEVRNGTTIEYDNKYNEGIVSFVLI